VTLSDEDQLELAELLEWVAGNPDPAGFLRLWATLLRDDLEANLVASGSLNDVVMKTVEGRVRKQGVSLAAATLDVAKSTIYRIIKRRGRRTSGHSTERLD